MAWHASQVAATTTITVMGPCALAQQEVAASDDLCKAVHAAVARATAVVGRSQRLDIADVVYASNNARVPNWQQSRVDNNPINVVVHVVPPVDFGMLSQQLQSVLGQVQDLTARAEVTDKQMAIASAPRVRNAAAQVLLHLTGGKLRTSRSTRFERLGARHPLIVELARGREVAPAVLVAHCDKIISRRNGLMHFGSLHELDQEAHEVQGLMTPELRRMCPWECFVMDHYQLFRQKFPSS